MSFTVNDLNHLQRGGRVSKTTAVVGSLVNIKPILTVTSAGELKSDGTVRGRKKSLKTLVSRMRRHLIWNIMEKTDWCACFTGIVMTKQKAWRIW